MPRMRHAVRHKDAGVSKSVSGPPVTERPIAFKFALSDPGGGVFITTEPASAERELSERYGDRLVLFERITPQ